MFLSSGMVQIMSILITMWIPIVIYFYFFMLDSQKGQYEGQGTKSLFKGDSGIWCLKLANVYATYILCFDMSLTCLIVLASRKDLCL